MNKVSQGELHIAVIGRRRVGKSLLVDRIIHKRISSQANPTESMEEPLSEIVQLMPAGPSVVINTASIEGQNISLSQNTNKCIKAISNSDIVLIVLDAREKLTNNETYLITYIRENQLPFLVAINKIEYGTNSNLLNELEALNVVYFEISCKENAGLESMKKKMIHLLPEKAKKY
jgi:small GTP-binding protein